MSAVERQLGMQIARLRKNNGLTQAELAERVGVSTETVSRMERGASVPSVVRLDAVAVALQVELHELFRFEDGGSARTRELTLLAQLFSRRPAPEIAQFREIAVRILKLLDG